MRNFSLGVFITLLMLLGGCESFPYGNVSVDTVNKSILVANTELRGANLLFQNLLKDGVITNQSEARNILVKFREAKDNLTIASEAVSLGNVSNAQDGLEKATGTIDVLIAILTPYANKEAN